jgi:alpha-galactosidase/6-phospho-beta-glucosidase family protein
VLDIKSAGLNHFTWILDVRDRRSGEDLYPAVRARFRDASPEYEPLTRDMLLLTGLLPATGDTHLSEYLPYTHNPVTRPWERYDLHLYQWEYAAGQRDTLWSEIERLAAPGGPSTDRLRDAESEGIFEVIHGLAHNANTYMEALNLPNGGTIAGLPEHAIVEAPAFLSGAGALQVRIGALPPIVAELCRREAERVELVVDAAVQGNREMALQALALDPTIDDLDLARAILDDALETHRAYLPQFDARRQP